MGSRRAANEILSRDRAREISNRSIGTVLAHWEDARRLRNPKSEFLSLQGFGDYGWVLGPAASQATGLFGLLFTEVSYVST